MCMFGVKLRLMGSSNIWKQATKASTALPESNISSKFIFKQPKKRLSESLCVLEKAKVATCCKTNAVA